MEENEFEIILGKSEEIRIEYEQIPERFYLWVLSNKDYTAKKGDGLKIFLSQQVYEEVNQHAKSEINQEVGGVLIGKVAESNGLYIVIDGSIRAELTKAGPGFVTFTHDTWRKIYQIMEKEFHNKRMVGWYHTHPRMGLFFSQKDYYVHSTLFPHPWQVGLVIEPVKNIAGFFRLDEKGIKRCEGFYELLEQEGEKSVIGWRNARREGIFKEEIEERGRIGRGVEKDSIIQIPKKGVIFENEDSKNGLYKKDKRIDYTA